LRGGHSGSIHTESKKILEQTKYDDKGSEESKEIKRGSRDGGQGSTHTKSKPVPE
jgi:hypothetical protein